MRKLFIYLSFLWPVCLFGQSTIPALYPDLDEDISQAPDPLLILGSGFMCTMVIDTVASVPPSCWDEGDGAIFMSAAMAASPVDYFLDGAGPFGPVIPNVFQGPHEVIAVDANGCRDTLNFTLIGRDTIFLGVQADSVDCFNNATGRAFATATGGAGGFSYVWNTIPAVFADTASNLQDGAYTVTATDARGCTITGSVDVFQPLPILSLVEEDSVSCQGGMDGRAWVSVTGGTPPYSYLWSTGASTDTISNQAAGFYSVTVIDANGCLDVNNTTIEEGLPIGVTATGSPALCFNANNGSATVVPSNDAQAPLSYTWSGTGGYTSTSDAPTNLGAGTYCVTLTDNRGCTAEDCVTITEPTALVLAASSTPPTCYDSADGIASVVASNGTPGYSYLWDATTGGQTTSDATGLAAGTYVVTVTDAQNCTAELDVSIGAPDTIIIQMDSTAVSCGGLSDGSATVTATGGGGNFQYTWDANAGGQVGQMATGLAAGTYCVSILDGNGCEKVRCVQIDAPPAIQIDSIVGIDIACFGDASGTAEVFHQGGTGNISFVWSDINNQVANPAVNLRIGTYVVTLTDDNNCQVIDSVTLSQPDSLGLSVSVDNVNCFNGTDGTATADVIGGVQPYTYNWNNGQSTAVAADLAAGSYSVTIGDANGCLETRTIVVGQPNTPLASSIVQTTQGCFDAQSGEALVSVTGGTGNYTYQWASGATDSLGINLSAGANTVIVTDANGCTILDTVDIVEYDSLTINTAFVKPTCFGLANGRVAVNAVEGGAGLNDPVNYQYFWDVAPTTSQAVLSDLVGNTTYVVTVTDQLGCSNVDSIFLQDRTQIEIIPSIEDVSCFGQNDGNIAINSHIGEFPLVNYQWDSNTNNQAGPTASNLAAGTYSVTVTDSLGCQIDTFIQVVQPAPNTVSFSTEEATCSYATDGAAIAFPEGGTGPYSYTWSNGQNAASNVNIVPGTYFVTIEDAQGCQSVDSVAVPGPIALEGELFVDGIRCADDANGQIQIVPMGGTPPFRYQLNDEGFNGVSTSVGLAPGEYDVQIRDANGCTWDTIAVVGAPPPLAVSAGTDIEISLGDSIVLNPEVLNAQGAYSLFWSAPNDTMLVCPDSICLNPMVKPQNTTLFTVSVEDEFGCRAKDQIQVLVLKDRFVALPTGFSPNGDGRNDLLLVHGKEGTRIVSLEVYDRWGERIFELTDFDVNRQDIGWDGTYRGKDVAEGVYLWLIEAEFPDGYRDVVKGHTTVIR